MLPTMYLHNYIEMAKRGWQSQLLNGLEESLELQASLPSFFSVEILDVVEMNFNSKFLIVYLGIYM